MMQELARCMSDIGRLLGTLGLLSSGITLTLWGLKRRRSGAVVGALLLCLAALVPTVLAIEIPPPLSNVYIQTTGPYAGLTIGDWYTNDTTDGPGYHSFEIYFPCTLAPTQVITVALFDPESNHTEGDDLDEVRPPGEDDTTFTLWAPDGATIVATDTYTPDGGTSQNWVTFDTFTRDDYDCGIYTLTVTTSDNDDNAWKLRVTPDNPDEELGTGDEISLGNLQTSFQNTAYDCQTFHFFVTDTTSSIRLSNFDMDDSGTIDYISPSGVITPGTLSHDSEWNNGGESFSYPPPGGDLIEDPEPGWWQAEFCVGTDNQYTFDVGPYFYEKPRTPEMSVSKDDGTTTFNRGGVLNYTITYENRGPGAALDAVLTDRLPLSTTFVSCTPRPGESCGEIPPPGSGIVTFSLGTIKAGESGSVMVSVHVDDDVAVETITNTVELDYTDIVFCDYPVETDIDVDYRCVSAIGDRVWHDADRDGVQDGGEEGLPGITIALLRGDRSLVGFTETITDGYYIFEDLDPGTCIVDVHQADPDMPASYFLTMGSEPLEVELGLCERYMDADFGYAIPEPTTTEPPTLTPSLTPTVPTATPTPTPTVVLIVERLPETGGFSGWLTVFLGVPIIIGAAGLLNLALLEMRGRRDDGNWSQ
jgi:uncharacterized repeat protein (TIGR01451 family)